MRGRGSALFFFFFNDTATTEIYTLSLHDALPILHFARRLRQGGGGTRHARRAARRSEEHTSELQSLAYLVCRLLLEKKKQKPTGLVRGSCPPSAPTPRTTLCVTIGHPPSQTLSPS